MQLDDSIHAGNGKYSKVLSCRHMDATNFAMFVRVDAGDCRIDFSGGHYLPVDELLMVAKAPKVGHLLYLTNGTEVEITSIYPVR